MKIIVYCLNILILISVSACSFLFQSSDQAKNNKFLLQSTREVKVFFTKSKKPDDIMFVPVARKIPRDDSIVDASLRELFLGPTKKEELKGIMTEIPVGTRLIKVEESPDEILIDLSTQFLTGGGSATMQLRYLQLYKTLKKIAPGKTLYLNVDGKNLKTIGGEGLEITQPLMTINDYTEKFEKNTENIK